MGQYWQIDNNLRPIIPIYGYADWNGTVFPTHTKELACKAWEQCDDMFIPLERSFPDSIRKFTTYP